MIAYRTVDGPSETWLFPQYRHVDFKSERAVYIMSRFLRFAWTATPPTEKVEARSLYNNTRLENQVNDDLMQFMKFCHHEDGTFRKEILPNPDSNSVHTEWRDIIYQHWYHVFHDIARFLFELALENFHVHFPCHDVLAIEIPTSDHSAIHKTWDSDILILPAYLKSNVSIRMTANIRKDENEEEERELGTFDGSNTGELWYIRAGTAVTLRLAQGADGDLKGLGAVMICGLLSRGNCLKCETDPYNYDEGNGSDEEEKDEVDLNEKEDQDPHT